MRKNIQKYSKQEKQYGYGCTMLVWKQRKGVEVAYITLESKSENSLSYL